MLILPEVGDYFIFLEIKNSLSGVNFLKCRPRTWSPEPGDEIPFADREHVQTRTCRCRSMRGSFWAWSHCLRVSGVRVCPPVNDAIGTHRSEPVLYPACFRCERCRRRVGTWRPLARPQPYPESNWRCRRGVTAFLRRWNSQGFGQTQHHASWSTRLRFSCISPTSRLRLVVSVITLF